MQETPIRVRIGAFELDLKAGELRKGERLVRLQEQPFQILLMLVERAGELVTRDEIKKKLWPNDTVVEFDHSIHTSIAKLRRALGDSADKPKYIETIASRGYRLMVPVEQLSVAGGQLSEPGATSMGAPPLSPSFDDRVEMALTGRTVSHYRVLDIIGGGGMGVVYRAEDLKLGRQVALKFLPEELGSDPQALERFSREARAASSLDHPNICPIFEFGEHEGRPFIVMQLLEGQTLRDQMAADEPPKPLSLEDMLDIGIQVSDGLQAAHEKGIIHRDIKPANLFLTSKGVVKILDFGLAKLVEAEAHPSKTSLGGAPAGVERGFSPASANPLSLSSRATRSSAPADDRGAEGPAVPSPHEKAGPSTPCPPGREDAAGEERGHSARDDNSRGADGAAEAAPLHPATPVDATLTRTGLAMGTAGYMSPEQVRGEKLDARTDIFSFGLVLYEMATGQRAFSGQTAAVVHDAILNSTPVPIRDLNSILPANLVTTIDKALEKDRDRRYQSAAEIGLVLNTLAGGQLPKKFPRTYAALAAAVLVLVALAGFFYARIAHPRAEKAPPLNSVRLTPLGNVLEPAALSSDARYFAYKKDGVGKTSLWLQQTGSGSTLKLTPDITSSILEDVTFSPDGTQLFYELRDRRTSGTFLYKVSALGGTPELFIRGAVGAVGFSPDGSKIAYKQKAEDGAVRLIVANANGSEPRVLYSGDKTMTTVVSTAPAWSPDGKLIAISEWVPRGSGSYCTISLVGLDGTRRELTGDHQMDFSKMIWLPDGSGIVFTANPYGPQPQGVFVASFPDGHITRITGANIAYFLRALGLSADGKSIFAIQRYDPTEFWLISKDSKQATQLQLEDAIAKEQSVSFDGRRVFYYSGVGETDGIWRWDLSTRASVRISPGDVSASQSSLSPDGQWITFSPLKNGRRSIWVADTEGGNLRQLVDGDLDEFPVFTADGKEVVFFRRGRDSGLYRVPFPGGQPTRVSDLPLGLPSSTTADGRVLCQYFEGENSRQRVAIVSLHDGSLIRLFDSPDWNTIPRFTRDGNSISYVDDHDGTSNIWIMPWQGGPAHKVTNFTSGFIYEYGWSLDGKQLVLIHGVKQGEAMLIQNFR